MPTANASDVEQRIAHAQERTVEFKQVDTNPIVVHAESSHSDRVHTIVPDSLHCSCEDATYNSPICYHLIALAMEDDFFGDHMRSVIDERADELEENREQLENKLADVRSEQRAVSVVREAIESPVDNEASQLVEELLEDR